MKERVDARGRLCLLVAAAIQLAIVNVERGREGTVDVKGQAQGHTAKGQACIERERRRE